MTVDGRTTDHDRGSDLAAYALGALTPVEAEELVDHLRRCPACREQLTALEHVVDAIPMAAPQHRVPAGLRRRVTRAIRADSRQPRPALGRSPRTLLAAVLAVLVLAVAAVGVAIFASGPQHGPRVIDASVVPAVGTAQVRISGGHGRLIVRDMPAPPTGRVYEVWLKRGNAAPAPTPALFGVTADGSADVDVPGDLSNVSQVLVTQEPAGGSRVSTHPPLIVARLS